MSNDSIKSRGIALLKRSSLETNNSTSCSKPKAIIRLSIALNFDHCDNVHKNTKRGTA